MYAEAPCHCHALESKLSIVVFCWIFHTFEFPTTIPLHSLTLSVPSSPLIYFCVRVPFGLPLCTECTPEAVEMKLSAAPSLGSARCVLMTCRYMYHVVLTCFAPRLCPCRPVSARVGLSVRSATPVPVHYRTRCVPNAPNVIAIYFHFVTYRSIRCGCQPLTADIERMTKAVETVYMRGACGAERGGVARGRGSPPR